MAESAIDSRPQGHAETLIAECNARGEVAEIDTLPEGQREVRASFLRGLFLARLLNPAAAPLGILMRGARITGALDLSGFGGDVAQAPALVLESCEFAAAIDLSNSSFHRVVLRGSKLPGLYAAYLRTSGPVLADFMTVTDSARLDFSTASIGGDLDLELLRADDESKAPTVNIARAQIRGSFRLSGARLISPNQEAQALLADGADITGSVYMHATAAHRFEAKGAVRLLGATIGGQLVLNGASLANPGGDALSLDQADITGGVFMHPAGQHRFEAIGAVRLLGAAIGGVLSLQGASLANPDGHALSADRADVTGSVFMRATEEHRFEAKGAVRLLGAKIGGNLELNGASFANPDGHALSADGADITGGVFMQAAAEHRFEAKGEVRLLGATIGGQLVLNGASLANPDGAALSADRADITGSVFMHATEEHRFEAIGAVRLPGAKIGGNLELDGASLANQDGHALSADGADITGSVFMSATEEHRFEAKGEVRFLGAKIGGNLNFAGAVLLNPNGNALNSNGANISGDALLRASANHVFEATGTVRLLGARIAGSLEIEGAILSNAGGDALNADGIQVGVDVLVGATDQYGLTATGTMRLLGARIGGDLSLEGAALTNPLGEAISVSGADIGGSVFLRAFGTEAGGATQPFKATGSVNFINSTIKGQMECKGTFNTPFTAVYGTLDLYNARIERSLHVHLCDDSCGIVDLRGLHVQELADRNHAGWGKEPDKGAGDARTGVQLRLDGLVYGRLTVSGPQSAGRLARDAIAWLERQFPGKTPCADDFYPQPYEQLAKTLRAMGHEEDARRVAVAKRDFQRRCGVQSRSARAWNRLFGWGFGYGYAPGRALITLALYWAIGAGAVWYAQDDQGTILVKAASGVELVRDLRDGNAAPRPMVTPRAAPDWPLRAFPELPCDGITVELYALDLFLPLIDLGQTAKCEVRESQRLWRWAASFYAICGWLVVSLAALTFSGVLRRD